MQQEGKQILASAGPFLRGIWAGVYLFPVHGREVLSADCAPGCSPIPQELPAELCLQPGHPHFTPQAPRYLLGQEVGAEMLRRPQAHRGHMKGTPDWDAGP